MKSTKIKWINHDIYIIKSTVLIIVFVFAISISSVEDALASNACNGFKCPTGHEYVCCSGSSGWGPWKETWEFYKGPTECQLDCVPSDA